LRGNGLVFETDSVTMGFNGLCILAI